MKIWRLVFIAAMLVFIGYAAVVGQTITVTEGPVPSAVPKFVQAMTPENYLAWATWQNEMAAKHKKTGWESSYIEGVGTRTTTDAELIGPRGRWGGSANTNFSGLTVSESFTTRFVNPDYTGPGPLTIYNPYCRFTENTLNPNWAEIYVITKSGVMTMTQAMAKHAPMPPEELFKRLMAPYFKVQ
jgi:hypothetical protein